MAPTPALLLLLLLPTTGANFIACYNTCTHASDGDCDDGGPGAEYYVENDACPLGSDCDDCGPRTLDAPPPPPSPSPPPPSPPARGGAMPSCAEAFRSAYDREACEENIALLPVDLGVGGGIILLLILPNVCFYFGLWRRRWRGAGGSAVGGECPFLGGSATNRCRVCKTFVSDRAFHRTCSLTTQQVSGNIVTTTTTTTHGWDHCVGCHFLKTMGPMALVLLGFGGLWAYTVVERALAVAGLTYRDERVWSFNVTMYCLTVVVGLVSWAIVWCARSALLKHTCLVPCCCPCAGSSRAASGGSSTAVVPKVAVAPAAPAAPAVPGSIEVVVPAVVVPATADCPAYSYS